MIVITAPTGDIGSQVLTSALAGDQPVRVIVRDPAKLSADVRERVEVFAGSHADAEVVDQAFEGADAVFWLVPPDPFAESLEASYSGFARPAVEAIRTHGVSRVVSVGALGRNTPYAANAGYVTGSLAMDDLFAASGAALRVLAMPSFMENVLRQTAGIKEGMFFGPHSPDLALPIVATRDIAAVAAKLLLDASWAGREEVPVIGPEDLSNNQLAATMSDVLGFPVRYQQTPLDAFKGQLTGRGMSEAAAQGMLDMMIAKGQGLDAGITRTPLVAADSPTTFRQWCEDTLKPAVLVS